MKLERYIQKAGITSRRKAPKLIESGRVKVNSKIAKDFFLEVDEEKDIIEVDGKPIELENKQYYLFNKPAGYITALKDPFKTPTINDFLKKHYNITVRVHPVGRLDKDTEGLLILTNDGVLTYKVLHPKMKVEKEYLAKVYGTPNKEDVKRFEKGMKLKQFTTSPARLQIKESEGNFSWITIVIREGKKRQVKRMCSHIGHKVVYLKRIRVGTFTLFGIEKPGDLKEIGKDEIEKFMIENQIV
jgi:pseudouridine synthase